MTSLAVTGNKALATNRPEDEDRGFEIRVKAKLLVEDVQGGNVPKKRKRVCASEGGDYNRRGRSCACSSSSPPRIRHQEKSLRLSDAI